MYVSCPRVHMSYVAEWRGGGPQDLLRGFDSFRNCQLNDFLWQQWLDLKRVVFLHRPFYLTPGMISIDHSLSGRKPFGIGSALAVRRTGIRSTRTRSGTRQGIRS